MLSNCHHCDVGKCSVFSHSSMSSSADRSSSVFPMADSLIVYTAHEFLEDAEACAWGRCSSSLLRAMRTYRIYQTVSIVQLLCRSEGRELLPALESEEFRTIPDRWPARWDSSLQPRLLSVLAAAALTRSPDAVSNTGAAVVTTSTLPPSANLGAGVLSSIYWTEIGRVCSVEINTAYLKDDQILTRLVDLPPCVTSIELTRSHGSHPIRLPSTCTILRIGNGVKTSALPTLLELPDPGLQQLVFNCLSNFSQPLALLPLPSTLHTLHLPLEFNQPVEHLNLPASLTDLNLGYRTFNQRVESLRLPDGLRSIRFAEQFNQPIERLRLPPSLTHLDLGIKFNHPLVEWHPPTSLTQLILGDWWKLPADHLRLPPSLLDLTLPDQFNHPITDALMKLPSTLRSFESCGCFNQSLSGITWPESLTNLRLGGDFCQPLDDWTPPPQLLTLSLGNYEWPIHRLRLPSSLTSLTLPSDSPPASEGGGASMKWPPRLLYLTLTFDACPSPARVFRTLPTTLKKLTLMGLYDHPTEMIQPWLSLPLPDDCQLQSRDEDEEDTEDDEDEE